MYHRITYHPYRLIPPHIVYVLPVLGVDCLRGAGGGLFADRGGAGLLERFESPWPPLEFMFLMVPLGVPLGVPRGPTGLCARSPFGVGGLCRLRVGVELL